MLSTTFTILAFTLGAFSYAASATTVNFVNLCSYTFDVVVMADGQPPALECTVDPGYYCNDNFGSNGIKFKSGWAEQNVTLAEFLFNGDYNLDSYDISVIDGFNIPMRIAPFPSGSPVVTCNDINCPDAMHTPSDRSKIHTSPTGKSFDVTFCPPP